MNMYSAHGWYATPEWQKSILSVFTILALVISMTGIMAVVPQTALAADTGFLSPTATHTPNGWTNGANGLTSDNAYATTNSESAEQGYGTFGFGVPGGSSIQGIEVIAEANSSDSSGCQLEVALSNNNGTSFTALKTAALSGTDSALAFGGAADLWGGTWNSSGVSDANFVARVSYDDVGPGNTCSGTTSLDHVQVKVYYTAPTPNPALANSCGIDVALVMDSSGSINSTNLSTMKSALNTFVGALLPATPTLFSVTDFDTDATVLQTLTNDTGLLTTAINAPTSGGNTNWEQAIQDAQGTLTTEPPARAGVPNIMIFASDGDPTYANDPGTNVADDVALSEAIAAANAAKLAGTRIITLGIGASVNVANLEAISSADAYYSAANFSDLSTVLNNIVTDLCGGTITVHKVIDADGDLHTTGDQTSSGTEVSGWNFDVGGTSASTDSTGSTASVPKDQGTYSVTETVQSGYSVVGASCTNQSQGAEGTWNQGSAVTGIELGAQDVISCTFYNTPNAGTLTVYKSIVNDNDGQITDPSVFTINVSGGNPSSFPGSESGTAVSVPANSQFSVSETPAQGYSASYVGDCSGTMTAGGSLSCTVVNDDVAPEPLPVCSDGLDNDGDGFADSADPGCHSDFDKNNPSSYDPNDPSEANETTFATCSDGLDNDGDDLVDLDDPQCAPYVPHLVVHKTVVNDNFGSASPTAFSFDVQNGANSFFDVFFDLDGQAGIKTLDLAPGSYSVSENAYAGYTSGSSGDCEGTIAIGQTKHCYFTNDDKPACSDTMDNDSDEVSDSADPGCHTDGNAGNSESYDPNDNDESNVPPPPAQCSDDMDNDEDQLTDQNDPGCHTDGNAGNSESYDPNDNDESNQVNESAPECSDGIDNADSEDSLVDSADPGCHNDNNAENPSSYTPNATTESNVSGGGGGGGGGGPLGGGIIGGGGGGGGPLVLGASTGPQVLGASCGLYMDKYLRMGSSRNDKTQTEKLQAFLNKWTKANLPVTGYFGPLTESAVHAFQSSYPDQILKPWNLSASTGLVYISTLRQINMLECPDLALQLGNLIPWSANPNAQ